MLDLSMIQTIFTSKTKSDEERLNVNKPYFVIVVVGLVKVYGSLRVKKGNI